MLVPFFVAGALLIAYLAVLPLGLEAQRAQGMALVAGGVLAGAASFFAAQKLEGNVPLFGKRPEPDDDRREAGHFMFVPLRYWSVILPTAGIALAMADRLNLLT